MTKKIRVWFSSGDFVLAALIIACAWNKLSWKWFWVAMLIEGIAAIQFKKNDNRKESR
jgi:hypothetical protein